MRILTSTLVFGTLSVGCLFGQSVLSVNSGLVHYAEGTVYAADKLVEPKFGHFPQLNNNDELRTEDGRAEVLLSPGSFLRIAENSAVRMVSNRLTDTKIELLKGEALIEKVDETKDKAAAMVKGNSITVLYQGSTISLVKSGVYVFNADPGRVRVFDGEAIISSNGTQLTLKKGKESLLDGALMATKFDAKQGDELVRWSYRRSGYVAMANVSAARSLRDSGQSFSGYGYGYGYGMMNGGWAYNPWYGMYTYVPWNGFAYSPFGYSYWSPYNVYRFYTFAPSYFVGGSSFAGSRNVGAGMQSLSGARTAPAFSTAMTGASHSAPAAFQHGGLGAGRMGDMGVSSGYSGLGGGRMSGGSSSMGSSGAPAAAAAAPSGGHTGGAGRR